MEEEVLVCEEVLGFVRVEGFGGSHHLEQKEGLLVQVFVGEGGHLEDGSAIVTVVQDVRKEIVEEIHILESETDW